MSVAIRWRIVHALVKFENEIHIDRDSVTHLIVYLCIFLFESNFYRHKTIIKHYSFRVR